MRRRLLAAGVLAVLVVRPAAAQSAPPDSLTETLAFLLTNQSVPTGDVERDMEAARVTTETLTRLLAVELATLPLTTGAAGFTYRFNPVLGTMERASASFGPFFTDRHITAGRGQFSIGATVQFASYSELDGRDLESGTLVTSGNQFVDEAQPFDFETLTLEVSSRVLTLTANGGVTDWLDVGVAVPFVSLSMEGGRVNTYYGTTLLQASATATASGIGDLALRAKARLFDQEGAGLAVIGEARLPTGREEDLLGAGSAAWRAAFVASVQPGTVGGHVNVGWSGGGVANVFSYRTAMDVTLTPQITAVGELVGRRASGIGHLRELRVPHPTLQDVQTIRLITDDTSTHTAAIVGGLKWNVASSWLVTGTVSVPVTSGGLKPDVVTLVGLDYAFGR
ncbi:MAG TPA: transporter [Vicinamibacterales bacterium]